MLQLRVSEMQKYNMSYIVWCHIFSFNSYLQEDDVLHCTAYSMSSE